jgi:uncharacterized membrane protein
LEKKNLRILSRIITTQMASIMAAFLFVWITVSSVFVITNVPIKYVSGLGIIGLLSIFVSAVQLAEVSQGEQPYSQFLRDNLLTDRYLRYKQKWDKGEE